MNMQTSISRHFSILTDNRAGNHIRHNLTDILTIVLCGVICGAEGFNDIELFAKCKQEFFESFLDLPNGIPSHDTMNRVMSALDPKQFSECFANWAQSLSERLKGVIAIDGKTSRRSFKNTEHRDCLHMVSAWSSDNGIVLAQTATDAKSNEITAIPTLLDMLDIKNCTVTIDAMGCQKAIADKIVSMKGNYLLALKGNQGGTLEMAEHLFKCEEKTDYAGVTHTSYATIEKGHGRIEKRNVTAIENNEKIDIAEFDKWKGLKSIIMVESTRESGTQSSVERRYYISSLPANAAEIGRSVRSHWGIENSLHWVLDVIFNEDAMRNRQKNSAANMAIIRHCAINLLKQDKSGKTSLRGKRLKAGWDNDYLLKLISEC